MEILLFEFTFIMFDLEPVIDVQEDVSSPFVIEILDEKELEN